MGSHEDVLARAAGNVSRETFERLGRLDKLVRTWNRRINLIGPATAGDIWDRHIVDSAQLVPLAPAARRWVDLGSGAGFPGLVVAILHAEDVGFRVHLVESNAKKAAFLSAATAELQLPAEVHRCRIEAAFKTVGPADVVSARALAPLPKLLELAEPWLKVPGCKGLFHKGRDFVGEVERARDEWRFDLIEHRSIVDPGGMILEIGGVRPLEPPQMERT